MFLSSETNIHVNHGWAKIYNIHGPEFSGLCHGDKYTNIQKAQNLLYTYTGQEVYIMWADVVKLNLLV